MKINKKILIVLSVLFIILLIISMTFFSNSSIINNLINKTSKSNMDDDITEFKLESKENDDVLLTFENANGIKQIAAPNGMIISGNGNKKIALDYKVDRNETYNFETTSMLNNVSTQSFIAPTLHIEVTRNNVDVDLNTIEPNIDSKLNNKLIATNFVIIGTGEKNTIDSTSTDMSTVFNTWGSFGDGNWSYNSSSKTVYNSKNSTQFTGYYCPDSNYEDIELSFNAKTTDTDDDIIGAMMRFNLNSSTSFTSYLLLLDSHDGKASNSNKGFQNGNYNGLNKIVNANLLTNSHTGTTNLTKLSVNKNLRWTRNTWQNYKIIAKGTSLKAYLDNSLIAEATDSSISRGSYGFLSFSQAKTSFADIVIKTEKSYTLAEILDKIEWNSTDINIVINLNNEVEPALTNTDLIDYFNTNNMYYIGIGSDNNQSNVETFINNIDNRGEFLQSTNYDTYMQQTADYIESLYHT